MSIAENSIKERLAELQEQIMQARKEEYRLHLELVRLRAGPARAQRLWDLRDTHPELADLTKEEIDSCLLGAGDDGKLT